MFDLNLCVWRNVISAVVAFNLCFSGSNCCLWLNCGQNIKDFVGFL